MLTPVLVLILCQSYLWFSLFLCLDDVPIVLGLHLFPALAQLKVVNDIEPVVDLVLGVDLLVLLLSHVVLQSGVVTEGTLTVQALKTI